MPHGMKSKTRTLKTVQRSRSVRISALRKCYDDKMSRCKGGEKTYIKSGKMKDAFDFYRVGKENVRVKVRPSL